MSEQHDKLRVALGQWRDSLVNLTGRNRLLNYRPTRASTIEFAGATSTEVYERIEARNGAYTIGTRPPSRSKPAGASDVESLEDEVLEVLVEFDYGSDTANLHADKTQLEVDRTLKRLAADARREYVDKGISVLYTAFGVLKWTDDSGDARTSPLILVPVSLVSDGPKQPLRLHLSDDEMSTNPALALKLAEYGIVLPSTEQVDEAMSSSGISGGIDLFREVKWPDDWAVEDFAVLANFAFAKEAMYRDLLENEETVLGSEVLQAMAGIAPQIGQSFSFDEIESDQIDTISPPETTPMILDADSSQRAAITAAIQGKSFVLDGPPGTGKSQTIANIIGTLVGSGKRVLFVSEKAVALDVVRDRLKSRGLDPFVLELHSHKAVRSEVAARLGQSLDMVPIPPSAMDPAAVEQTRELRLSLSGYADAMNEKRLPLGRSLHAVLGDLARLESTRLTPPMQIDIDSLDSRRLGAIKDEAVKLASLWNVSVEGDQYLWWGLQDNGSLPFDIQQALGALQQFQSVLDEVSVVSTEFSSTPLDSGSELHDLLAAWHSHPEFSDERWLTQHAATELATAADRIKNRVSERTHAEQESLRAAGENWANLPVLAPDTMPTPSAALAAWWPQIENGKRAEMNKRAATADSASAVLTKLTATIRTITDSFGLATPSGPAEVISMIEIAEVALGDTPPLAEWLAPHKLDQVEGALATVRSAMAAEETAKQSASSMFDELALGSDLAGLIQRFSANSSFFGRFKREYKTDLSELARICKGDPKQAITSLPLAQNWSLARESRVAAEADLGSSAGSYFDGPSTDWARTTQAIAGTRRVLSPGVIVDAGRYSANLAPQATRPVLASLLAGARNDVAEWGRLSSQDGSAYPPDVALGALDAAEKWTSAIASELKTLERYLQSFESVMGEAVTLMESRRALDARSQVQQASERVTRDLSELAPVLGRFTHDGRELTTADIVHIDEVVTWTLDVRSAASRLTRAENATALPTLTVAQLKAFGASYAPRELRALSDSWIGARARILAAFGPEREPDLREEMENVASAERLLVDMRDDLDGPIAWFEAKKARAALQSLGLEDIVAYCARQRVPAPEFEQLITRGVLQFWTDHYLGTDERLNSLAATDLDNRAERFRDLDRALVDNASATIIDAGLQQRPRSNFGQTAIIRHEAEKKRKHIPVRQLIDSARDVIQAIHPCFMMSPLAVSQYLPADLKFDYVIFDEASQVTPGDAINCIYRGRALIAAGDQRQLPPTSFFTASNTDDDTDEENLAADYESILDLMKSSGHYNSMTLRWHYRSRHEHLIAYSNSSFYKSRLITFPSAIDQSDDIGVKYFHVGGVYRRSAGQDNPAEALEVAKRVIHHFDTRPDKSLGVVAFSANQRDAIESALELSLRDRPDLKNFFDDDRVDGFFIKSLEYVQGDERDVIIFSIGYGPDEFGRVYKNFGALNRQGGERRLNVAITRARELVEVVTSMSSSQMGDVSNEGARHLRRYLDFAERGPEALAMELGDAGLGTDSPFEDSVIEAIRGWGFDVQPQVGVAGYRIDIGVKHPNSPGAFMLGVECDGAMYHSSRAARDRDRLRHELLEKLGWQIHHIWGTGWYRNRDREMAKLKALLEALAAQPAVGRVGVRASQTAAVELDYEPVAAPSTAARWAIPYEMASPTPLPQWMDPGDPGSRYRLTQFVHEVAGIESPVHLDTVSARLREAAGVGRIGHRILATLIAAIESSDVQFDGQFLTNGDEHAVRVRTPTNETNRGIDLVSDAELLLAIQHTVREAAGISRLHVYARVSGVFGWVKKSQAMISRLDVLVDQLIESEAFEETGAGIRQSS